jgi:hypothetical protein
MDRLMSSDTWVGKHEADILGPLRHPPHYFRTTFGSTMIISKFPLFDLAVVTMHSGIRYCLRVVVAAGHRA